MSTTSSKPQINLLRGWPNPSLLPTHLIASAAASALSDPDIAHPGLLYGPDEGYGPVRESIASWLTAFYRPDSPDAVTSERICITGGASQNLGCVLSVFTDPEYTQTIWIGAPAYYLAFRVFQDAGFAGAGRMRAVPEDDGGISVKVLRQQLEKAEEAAESKKDNSGAAFKRYRPYGKVYKHIIYCVPTFSNPSSRTMPLERRQDLVRLARDFDALIVCDDVYDLLQWPTKTPNLEAMGTAHLPRLVDVDRDLSGAASDGFGNVVSNGSFSKLAGPGLRCGWAEGTQKLAHGISQAGTTCSGGAPSQLTSTYVNEMLQQGTLQRHIKTVLRPAYASRYQTLMRAVDRYLLPLGFELPQPDREVVGGFFVWLGLPDALTAPDFAQRCQRDVNVVVGPGKIFEVPGDESVSFEGNVRLCFAWVEEQELAEGIERMGAVAKKMLEERESGEYVVVEKGTVAGEFGAFK